jgi:4'-phosphopantetheinyl transferase
VEDADLQDAGFAEEGIGREVVEAAVSVYSLRWAHALESEYERDFELLTAGERERAERFRFELHRKRWVFARAWLRRTLGEALGVEAAALDFRLSPLGKPYLARNPLYFNLSHSGDYAVLAWSEVCEVGVDIEERRGDFAWEDVAAQAFSTAEQSYLAGLQEEERHAAFYDIWTMKEAYVKALGCGIGEGTNGFSVKPKVELGQGWALRQVEVESGYSAAVAWNRELR